MNVYALIGPSGTGKSHKAIYVANERGIDTIIDDGLLISKGRKIAGFSAKAEETMIGAVKRAIFLDDDHANEVKKSLKIINAKKILILGTSEKMIDRILERLDLDKPVEYIYIEDISSEIDIVKAQKMRNAYGKHVIPVPTIEIKKDFPNYFLDSLKFFINKKDMRKVEEKTIIRPKFSMYGKLIISENAIAQICRKIGSEHIFLKEVSKIQVELTEDGVSISLTVVAYLERELHLIAFSLQEILKGIIEDMTGLTVLNVNIYIRSVAIREDI